MERRIPLIDDLRSEVLRLAAAAGGEAKDSKVFELMEQLEGALRFLLALASWAEDKVASPQVLQRRLKEFRLK